MLKLFFFMQLIVLATFAQGETKMDELQTQRSRRIHETFNALNAQSMSILDDFYDKSISFRDPVTAVNGLTELKKYYLGLYKNVEEIKFSFHSETIQENTHVLTWTMHLKVKSLNAGKPIAVDGVSHITFNPDSNRVIYHRDYFDMGEFIYERIPILKNIVLFIKNRLHESK